jgi:hypothetical protein
MSTDQTKLWPDRITGEGEASSASTRETTAEEVAPAPGLTPGQAIRAHCLWCAGDSKHEVKLCPAANCPLWPWRFGRRPETVGLERGGSSTASVAITRKCRDCHERRGDCRVADCQLHPIRAKAFCGRSTPSTGRFQRLGASGRVGRSVVGTARRNTSNYHGSSALAPPNPERTI